MLATAIVITACDDDCGPNDNDLPPPFDPNYPLKGTWYEVRSTAVLGTKVVFTDTNFTAIHYANNYVYKDIVFNYEQIFYDNTKYSLDNDTFEMFDHYFGWNKDGKKIEQMKTKIIFYTKDTLFIENFLRLSYDVNPPIYDPITLIRRPR